MENITLEFIINNVIKVVLVGGGLWISKAVLSELIKRWFNNMDKKNQLFDYFNKQLADIVSEIKLLRKDRDHFKEMDEEYKSQIEDRFVQIAISNKEKINELKEDIAGVNIVGKERHSELKGKIKKAWTSINNNKERLDKIIIEHEIHHK